MKQKILILICFLPSLVFSQSFFSEKVVQKIEIQFAFDDWDNRLDTAATGAENYTLAKSVTINGQKFDSVGVKYKGNSSFKVANKKNPLHIELDFVKKQDYQGFKDIKLSNVFADPTFVKEQLAYDILRKYMAAPDCNQAQVFINGQFYGVMTNSESINKNFLDSRFDEDNGAFFKCNPPESLGASGLPSLVFLGQDSSLYQKHYELKSKTGWKQLVDLISVLNTQTFADINTRIDIDRTLWMLAYNNVFVNLDSYSGQFAQNYYLYSDNTNRFLPIIWDLNMCFGGFTRTGESPALSIANLPKLNPFLHENSIDRPLIKNLLVNGTYRKMYVAKMQTLIAENLANGNYYKKANEMQAIIDTLVQKDSNKFFTYQQFKENMTTPASGAGAGGTNGVVPGLKSICDDRVAFLKTVAAFNYTPPKIDTVIEQQSVLLNQDVVITAKITNVTNVSLRYRFEKNGKFTPIQMFDDGKHDDGAANDNVFGASFLMINSKAEYYIFAENAQAAAFMPVRAEYEFFTVKVNQSTTKISYKQLSINELMSSNTKTIKDENGDFDDYIELKNNTATTIDLSNVFVTDDVQKPLKWQFKPNTTLKSGEYIIIWADESESQGATHANFKLSANGEKIYLYNLDETLIDSISFPKMGSDVVYARCPDGIGNFKITTPSFGKNNGCSVAVKEIDSSDNFDFYPNPATHFITISQAVTNENTLHIYHATNGNLMFSTNELSTIIDVNNWQSGVYILKKGHFYKKMIITNR
jgi:CotH kinase protein/Lamin Tail Domain/Secretion system C-terminal sorting domain